MYAWGSSLMYPSVLQASSWRKTAASLSPTRYSSAIKPVSRRFCTAETPI